jgi:hypothetical protein
MNNSFFPKQFHAYRIGLFVVLSVYLCLYGYFLWVTGSLPYVMDNNESWSVLWHAANLANFGLSESFGLADESFSPHAAAHPFVHTHQGNFPRFFGLLLYLLGARTIELQIALTTLTVGTGVIYLGYRFFARVCSPLLALVLMLLLMGDYLLFAQWQVNTYRVWQGFLLFLALNCAEEIGGERRRFFFWMTTGVVACLAYSEIVFTVFVTGFAGLWAIYRNWLQPRRIFAFVGASAIGGCATIAVLVVQLVGYLGWDGFVRDVQYTFFARNFAADAESLRVLLEQFYDRHNVAFWFNIQGSAELLTFKAFFKSFFQFDFQILTPFMVLLSGTVILAGVLSLVAEKLRWGDMVQSLRLLMPRPAMVLIPLWYLLLINLCKSSVLLGNGPAAFLWVSPSMNIMILALAGSVVFSLFLVSMASQLWPDDEDARDARIFMVALYLSVVTGYLYFSPLLFGASNAGLLAEVFDSRGLMRASFLAAIFAAFAGASVIVIGLKPVLRAEGQRVFRKILLFMVLGLAAYALTYIVFPGYLYSGYLGRTAPFTVFITIPVVATAFFILIGMVGAGRPVYRKACNLFVAMFRGRAAKIGPGSQGGPGIAAGAASLSSLIVCVYAVFYWGHVQTTYMRFFPPDHYAFLKDLSKAPYAGKTAAVNNYAAPVAAALGNWAYYDPKIESGLVRVARDGWEVQRDARTYLWFADRKKNRAYLQPDLFVCMIPQSRAMVALNLKTRRAHGAPSFSGCESKGIVRNALKKTGTMTSHKLLAMDRAGIKRYGYAAWAVVALNHDFPPALVRVSNTWSENISIGLSLEKSGHLSRLRLAYNFVQSSTRLQADKRVEIRILRRSREKSCGIQAAPSVEIGQGMDLRTFTLPKGFTGVVQVVGTPFAGNKKGIMALSRALWIGPGEVAEIHCPVPPVAGQVGALEVKQVLPGAVRLEWQNSFRSDSQKIQMKTGCGAFRSIGVVSPLSNHYTVGSLSLLKRYAFRVKQCYGGNCIKSSRVVLAPSPDKTPFLCPLPTKPQGVNVRRLDDKTIIIGWDNPGKDSVYNIEMQRDCSSFKALGYTNSSDGRYHIGSASNTATYRIRLKECVGGECYSYTQVLVVAPKNGLARACQKAQTPQNVRATRMGKADIMIDWPKVGNGSIYKVEMSKNCSAFKAIGHTNSSDGRYHIGSVAEDGKYRFRLRECIGASCSQASTILTVPDAGGRVQSCSGDVTGESWSRQWIK